ncbi:type III secretion system (T3SS) SseB-like protein [Micromonospora violae]|uniref:Type III secretion system (T3SS) SseB-like protein n=1 Tax=Micromonospora violae TaxID=1278207 RepID=A0A4Q7UCC5_9ACTN|nr:SseB family protein [Micromonospora violae]RZT78324.1 type III secretion system (T3SS) SseB-like protein [Micromonospora violae]
MTTPSPTWPQIVARLRDTVARCDRDTDLELSAGPRGIRLLVRRQVVRVICPGHDEARLAALGWHRPTGDEGWWYETPRTPEQVERLSVFVTRTAAEVLTDEPGALSCRAVSPAAHPAPATRPTPARPTPANAKPAQATPVQAGPAQATPAQATPAQATPAQATPAQAGPADATPVEAGPVEVVEPAVVAVLAAAVERRDLPGYLGALAGATVCVPLAAEPSPEADFPWTVVGDATGAPMLPVFTSPRALAAFTGDGVPFIALPCADLFEDWPDPSWGLTVDPGNPRSLTLAAPALAALLTANLPTP